MNFLRIACIFTNKQLEIRGRPEAVGGKDDRDVTFWPATCEHGWHCADPRGRVSEIPQQSQAAGPVPPPDRRTRRADRDPGAGGGG